MPPHSQPKLSLVRWQALTGDQQQAVRRLRVSGPQTEYAGTVEQAIANCESTAQEHLAGLAILEDADAVGFLLLRRGPSAPEWAKTDAAVVSALRIDLDRQGQGLGSAALVQLPHWIRSHWPGTARVSLAVDEDNHAGISAYQNAGFTDEGVRVQGRIGWVRYLSASL